MALTKTEKATALFDSCSLDEMKAIVVLAKDSLRAKIQSEENSLIEKQEQLKKDKELTN